MKTEWMFDQQKQVAAEILGLILPTYTNSVLSWNEAPTCGSYHKLQRSLWKSDDSSATSIETPKHLIGPASSRPSGQNECVIPTLHPAPSFEDWHSCPTRLVHWIVLVVVTASGVDIHLARHPPGQHVYKDREDPRFLIYIYLFIYTIQNYN